MAVTHAKLPVEICDLIIDYARDDLYTMRRLACVSRRWHARSTVWLFNTIQVVDDLIGDARYIFEGAPYATIRLHSLARFLASQPLAILRHIHRLRIACFWHDDEDSWFEFVSTWTSTPLPASLAIRELHVFVKSRQNVGSLLQALAFRFPAVKLLHVHGTFAQGAAMATCFASFPSLKELGFWWSGAIRRSVLDVLIAAPGEWQAMPHNGCRLVADVSTLRPLLLLFRTHRQRVKDVMVENINPSKDSAEGVRSLVRVLRDLSQEDRNLIRGLHFDATQVPLSLITLQGDSLRTSMETCPQLRLLQVTATYGSNAGWFVWLAPRVSGGLHTSKFDPISTIARMLWDISGPNNVSYSSLHVLLVELTVSADEISLLWHHDWACLDRLLRRDTPWRPLKKVVISLCLTESECLGTDDQRKALDRFVRHVMPLCANAEILETRFREIPRRARKKMLWVKPTREPRAEDSFIHFSHTDFEGPGGLQMLDELERCTS